MNKIIITFLFLVGITGEDQPHERLGKAIGKAVAHGDIQREAQGRPPAAALIFEREIPVEEIAHHACKRIAQARRWPVGKPGEVIQQEHQAVANERVEHAHEQELPQFFVKQHSELFFHTDSSFFIANRT